MGEVSPAGGGAGGLRPWGPPPPRWCGRRHCVAPRRTAARQARGARVDVAAARERERERGGGGGGKEGASPRRRPMPALALTPLRAGPATAPRRGPSRGGKRGVRWGRRSEEGRRSEAERRGRKGSNADHGRQARRYVSKSRSRTNRIAGTQRWVENAVVKKK